MTMVADLRSQDDSIPAYDLLHRLADTEDEQNQLARTSGTACAQHGHDPAFPLRWVSPHQPAPPPLPHTAGGGAGQTVTPEHAA